MPGPEPDVHWGVRAVDPAGRSLPSLKARFLLEHVGFSGMVMEVGCGEGKMLRTLAGHRPALELHGCDIRPPRGVPDCFTFHSMTGGRIPARDQTLDAVLLFDVLEHVDDPAALLEEISRCLRPGGRLIAFVPVEGEPFSFYALFRRLLGRDTYAVTKEHVQAFRHRELRALVGQTLQVVDYRYAYHLVGHALDATFFAAAKLPALRRFWWQENSFYNDERPARLPSRVLNRLLEWANTAAFYESRMLASVRLTSAGALVTAVNTPGGAGSAAARPGTGIRRDANGKVGRPAHGDDGNGLQNPVVLGTGKSPGDKPSED